MREGDGVGAVHLDEAGGGQALQEGGEGLADQDGVGFGHYFAVVARSFYVEDVAYGYLDQLFVRLQEEALRVGGLCILRRGGGRWERDRGFGRGFVYGFQEALEAEGF